jgi:hypothetical protein
MKNSIIAATSLVIFGFAGLGFAERGLARQAKVGQRNYSVTDFDRIRVIGPYTVSVETGKAPSAKATGSAEALDRVSVSVQGRVLVIKSNTTAWGGWPGKNFSPPLIKITVSQLRGASLEGAGSLTISKMRAARINLALGGAGSLTVAGLDTDRVDATIVGSGLATLSGATRLAYIAGGGTSGVTAPALKVTDLDVNWQSAGSASLAAVRTAKVQATGSGNVTVTGRPACTVVAAGAGTVVCANVEGSTLE